jgi:hypothetical protein
MPTPCSRRPAAEVDCGVPGHPGRTETPIAKRLSAFISIPVVGLAAGAEAGGVELAAFAGPSFPRYEQSFRYDPGTIAPPLPGITIQQAGLFQLDASGGLALGASATWSFAGPLGIEARVDSPDVEIAAHGARYDVSADLPPPLPDLRTAVELGAGSVALDRLRPLSLNLRLATPGPVRLVASGGVSYLPELAFTVVQTVGLGVVGVDGRRSQAEVATLSIRAEAAPNAGRGGRLGLNAGGGLRLSVLPRVSVLVDARAFVFRSHTLVWSRGASALPPLQEALWREVERRLEPVELDPTLFQATAGLAIAF